MAFLSYNILLLLLISFVCIAKSADPSGSSCNGQSFAQNSQLSTNIDTLLTKLVQTTARNGYGAASSGKSKDQQVYGLAQCRGDVSSKDCSSCIQDAAAEIRKVCPNKPDARIWYDYCFLRYNTQDFRGKVDTTGILFANVENVTDPESFNNMLGSLMDKIDSQAAKSNKGFGKGVSKVSPFVNVYALVQCTRDLPPLSCAQCLAAALENFSGFCQNKKGCRVLFSSCFVRYELYPFFFPLNASQRSSEIKHIYVDGS